MRFYTLNVFEDGRLADCRTFRAMDDQQAIALADDAIGNQEAQLVSGIRVVKSYKPKGC